MNESLVPYIAAMAALNLLALAALVWVGRDRRRASSSPRQTVAAEPLLASASDLEGDPLESLVREVEKAESSARGEARLAEDMARWRRRAAGGDALPQAAVSGRGAAAGRREGRVA
jgi:hypothetical protein